MKKIILFTLILTTLLFGKSEEYYMNKHDLYTEKIIELREERAGERRHKDGLEDFKHQFSMSGARRQVKEIKEEIKDIEDDIEYIEEKIEKYEEKIEELKINAEEDLGKKLEWNLHPKWFEHMF